MTSLQDRPELRARLAAASLAAAPLHTRERQADHMIRVLAQAAAGAGDRVGVLALP